jgi:hypothetical protein
MFTADNAYFGTRSQSLREHNSKVTLPIKHELQLSFSRATIQ